MAGRSRYGRSRRSRGSRTAGIERARQHIREAEELTRQLGGTDQDVKEYFFGLSSTDRTQVLQLYGQKHGEVARRYAEETIPRWRAGRVKMAGQTAARLFDLLPPLMPVAQKYHLAENLWRHVGPSSKRRLRVGLDGSVDDAVAKVREHMEAVIDGYTIPDSLTRRFEWLAAGDVGLKQKLLNHLQDVEKKLVVEDARQHLPVMLEHLKSDAANYTTRLARTLTVGKHELEILLDRSASGVQLEQWRPQSAVSARSNAWLWWLLALGVAIAVLALRSH